MSRPGSREWVSDELYRMLGMSSDMVEEFVLSTARSAKSSADLARQLESVDLPDSDATRQFAEQLYVATHAHARKPSASTSEDAKRRELVESILRKNATYTAEPAEPSDAPRAARADDEADRHRRKKRRRTGDGGSGAPGDQPGAGQPFARRMRQRRADDDDDDESAKDDNKNNDEAGSGGSGGGGGGVGGGGENSATAKGEVAKHVKSEGRHGATRVEAPSGDPDDDVGPVRKKAKYDPDAAAAAFESAEAAREAAREAERLADIAERDALAARIRERDEERTKKLSAVRDRKAAEEAKLRAKLSRDQEAQLIEQLRVAARQTYLTSRESDQLAELRQELADEERLFDYDSLTAEEKRAIDVKRSLLALAESKKALEAPEATYALPDAEFDADGKLDTQAREAKLKARLKDPSGPGKAGKGGDAAAPHAEQLNWEDSRIRTALGGTDKPRESADGKDGYELVIDADEIEFVSRAAATLAGENAPPTGDEAAAAASASAPMSLAEVRRSLPIFAHREGFLQAIDSFQVLVLVGETGSGKTTQLPQYLYEHGYTRGSKKIGCTQPRRVAAMSVAKRVSDEMGVRLGAEVGYSIRFEDCTSERTVIKYMTDGMLFREFLNEPDLASYSVLIIDEAHERTLHTDVLLGLIKDIARFRADIKIIISSATMDAEKFSAYFDDAPIFRIPGRRYPVDIFYTKAPEAEYVEAAVVAAMQIHRTQPRGDILVFLTGESEIEAAKELLETRMRGRGTELGELIIAPIYAALPSEMQGEIFKPTPAGARKIILATNIAETSITIDGIVYVIDPGMCKQKAYNPRSGMESLVVTPASKAAVRQRAGRAGRVGPGKCFRLFTAWSYENELPETTIPEIQRTNLGNVVLMLKSLGIDDLVRFDFLDAPPAETMMKALEQLYALGALNDRGQLTKLGRRMAEFPLDPQLSKMLIAGEQFGCVGEMCTIAAMLSVGNGIFYRPKDRKVHAEAAHKQLAHPDGDMLTLMNVFNQWRDAEFASQWCFESYVQYRSMKKARDVREQLVGMLDRVEIAQPESECDDSVALRKAITAGYFFNTARLNSSGSSYRVIKGVGTDVQLHPSSGLKDTPPLWVLFHELVLTSKEFMRNVIAVQPEWLAEIAPHYFKPRDVEAAVAAKRKLPKTVGRANE